MSQHQQISGACVLIDLLAVSHRSATRLMMSPLCSITWTLNDVSASPPSGQLFHSPRLNVPWSVCPRRTLIGF